MVTPLHGESGAISAVISDITACRDVFALHVGVAVKDGAPEDVFFTPEVADEILMIVCYSDGAHAEGGLGRHSMGVGVALAKMESSVTRRRIDAHMALAPLPSSGDIHIRLAEEDGSKLGEWLLRGDMIRDASATVAGDDQA